MKPFDRCEGMLKVTMVHLRGLNISSGLRTCRKDMECDLLNGDTLLYCPYNMGGHLALAMQPTVEVSILFSRAVSCVALKHCLHILMLILGGQEQM